MTTKLTRPDEMAIELEQARARIAELEEELGRRNVADDELRASEEKYRTLVESSPYCIKLVDDKGRLLSMNRSGLEMVNEQRESDIIGRHYLRVVSEQDLERVTALLEKALAGEPSEFDFHASVGRYFRSNFIPIVDARGQVTRLLSITQDVTDHRRLIDELNHRVKNNLAAVLALSEQTRRSTQSLDEFTQVLEGRIRALARSHDALARTHWEGVDLDDIVELAIGVNILLDSGRVKIRGDGVLLPARVCGPLTLTLHELTTNALKHGAFSVPEGHVEIDWSAGEDDTLELRWVELGGPAPEARAERGVGMSLIRGFIEHELNGSLEIDLPASGLTGRMTIPLGYVRDGQ